MAYALEKLEERAEVNVVLRRHAEYVAGYLESQRLALLTRILGLARQRGVFRIEAAWANLIASQYFSLQAPSETAVSF
jgi:predicted ATPase